MVVVNTIVAARKRDANKSSLSPGREDLELPNEVELRGYDWWTPAY
jgi:hypothetical protein